MDDSMITCEEVIKSYDEKIKTIPINFNEKKVTCKMQSLYLLLAFLLITVTFFSDIIYVENFDPNNTKIDEKSYKKILIYYIGYKTIKKDLK